MSLRFLGQDIGRRLKILNAGVSELADETDSKSVIRKGVWVRVPPPAPLNSQTYMAWEFFLFRLGQKFLCSDVLGSFPTLGFILFFNQQTVFFSCMCVKYRLFFPFKTKRKGDLEGHLDGFVVNINPFNIASNQ